MRRSKCATRKPSHTVGKSCPHDPWLSTQPTDVPSAWAARSVALRGKGQCILNQVSRVINLILANSAESPWQLEPVGAGNNSILRQDWV